GKGSFIASFHLLDRRRCPCAVSNCNRWPIGANMEGEVAHRRREPVSATPEMSSSASAVRGNVPNAEAAITKNVALVFMFRLFSLGSELPCSGKAFAAYLILHRSGYSFTSSMSGSFHAFSKNSGFGP